MKQGEPSATPKRHVVFDIGNVLIRWDPRNLYHKMFPDEAAMEAFLAEACSMEWISGLDVGDVSSAVAARVALYPQHEAHLRAFDERWFETLGDVIEENVALFRRLKDDGEKVFGITNYPADKFELSRPKYPFLDWFDGVIVSGREGVAKPDPRIFRLLLTRFALEARNTIFIDDNPANVQAARDVGMDAIHYAPGLDLAAEFAKRGVLGEG